MLTFPAMLALVASSVGAFVAVLATRLARAGGLRDRRSIVPAALTAMLYAVGDLGTYAVLPATWQVGAQRLSVAFGALHVAAWLRFADGELGPGRLRGRAWIAVATIAPLALVPGITHSGRTNTRVVPGLALVYHEAELTLLGLAATLLIAGSLVVVTARYAAAWRRGAEGAAAFVAAFAVYSLVTLNDILAAAGVLPTPSLLDAAFFAPLGVAVF